MAKANELLIKGMVCGRCTTVLRKELEKFGLTIKEISMGKVVLEKEVDEQLLPQVQALLSTLQFDLLIDKQTRFVSQIKEIIHATLDAAAQNCEARLKLSSVLADKLNMGYSSLSEFFSREAGISIEQYVKQSRLDKVKELLKYSDHTLTEISYITGFSSIHHLSKQFKDLTGLTPSEFRSQTRQALCI